MSTQSVAKSTRGPRDLAGSAVWATFAVVLVVVPWVFRSNLALTMGSQMGYLIVVCLSYNVLLGQGGMLSFGHAVYTGLGGFVAIHAMNAAARGQLSLPLWALPIVGGFAGLFFSALLGWVTTRRAGTTFAMITLGLGELIASLALMLPSFFGGEGGVSGDRVYGKPFFGLTFGPQVQVYYLIALYCFVCTVALYAFTRTPLGRMLNAVRDNAERVEFVGYSAGRIRYLAFMIAGFFAGIGGALAAISFEIVNAADSLSAARSGAYLLFTFVGGAGFFFGPIIGAVLLVFASVFLSEITKAWQFYFGLAFVLMVIYAPGGIASLVMALIKVIRHRKLKELAPAAGLLVAASVPLLLSACAIIEMAYHKQLARSMGAQMSLFGIAVDVSSKASWVAALAALLIGVALFTTAHRRFARAWDAVQDQVLAAQEAGSAQ